MTFIKSIAGTFPKFLFILSVAAVPFLTNCQARYGETSKQAPLPGLAPKVAPAVAAPVNVKPTSTNVGGKPSKISKIDKVDDTDDSTPTGGPVRVGGNSDDSTPSDPQGTINLKVTVTKTNPQSQCNVCSAPQVQAQAVEPQNVPCSGGTCTKAPFVQQFSFSTPNMDILFVIDSKSTLADQRFALAQNIDSFLNSLPTNLNYRLAVLNTQDTNSSLFATPSTPDPISYAEIRMLEAPDRAKAFEKAKRELMDRVAMLNTENVAGSSERVLQKLESAVTTDLKVNQSKGFFRADAGLVIVSLTDERLTSRVNQPACSDQAFGLYKKLTTMKTLRVRNHMLERYPVEWIAFATLDADENKSTSKQSNSELLELVHLDDGILFDAVKAEVPEQMKADLRVAGSRIANIWMKRRFEVIPSQAMDPKSICVIANGKLLPTKFIEETNEVRIDPIASKTVEPAGDSITRGAVYWCENGSTTKNSYPNEYSINASCNDVMAKFNQ